MQAIEDSIDPKEASSQHLHTKHINGISKAQYYYSTTFYCEDRCANPAFTPSIGKTQLHPV
jgi:hypothetical protein